MAGASRRRKCPKLPGETEVKLRRRRMRPRANQVRRERLRCFARVRFCSHAAQRELGLLRSMENGAIASAGSRLRALTMETKQRERNDEQEARHRVARVDVFDRHGCAF